MPNEAPRSEPELHRRWPAPREPVAQVVLALDETGVEGGEPPAHDISAVARIGETLFLAADECADLEMLHRVGETSFAEHKSIALGELFDLPDPKEEMDIEGLAIDDDWLWVLGSHSLTRKKPKKDKRVDQAAIDRLAELKDNRNRMFVGRMPLRRIAGDGERWEIETDGGAERRPQMLPIKKQGSPLVRLLAEDAHLAPFLSLPAKENGLDIEGVILDGERLGLGLRGPVINGWALALEVKIKPNKTGLKLAGGLRKHWLDLGGLGIRDLKRRDEDVIILAGPTMDLDGPARIFRWRDWREDDAEALVHKPEWLMDLPYGQGCDHPEALAPWSHAGASALLAVCDSPAPSRLTGGGVVADVFTYPD